jgi:uncharacterized membrane protein YhaH (DUF805 family)
MAAAYDADDLKPRTFVNSIAICLHRYFQFRGRAPRAEYWYFVLFQFLAGIAADIVDLILFGPKTGIISSIVGLALLIPSLAVWCRRIHDIDRTGWWWLLALVPVVGWIILLVWACTPGTSGPNRYGSDPYAAVAAPLSSAPAA